MRIDHGDAVSLEGIVRRVFACQRGEMGGYIDADHFESQPFDAAWLHYGKRPTFMKQKTFYLNVNMHYEKKTKTA